MRNRQQPGATTDAPPVARQFAPADLDVDDLAEAIRLLLGSDHTPQSAVPDEAISNLLSFPKRGSHGVEAEAL
jgi:hypothetical protein